MEQVAPGEPGLGQPARLVLTRRCPQPAALSKRVSWDFKEAPLSELISALAADPGLTVRLDRPALAEEGVTSDVPVTVQVHDLALPSALKIVLGQYSLTYLCHENSILITSRLEADNQQLDTRLYPVADLLTGTPEELRQYAEELQEIIEQTVWPNCWSSVGGLCEIAIFAREQVMIVRQTAGAHDAIEQRLTSLRTGQNPSPSEDEAKIMRALAQPISCEVENMPLRTAVQYFSDLCGVPNIMLDPPAMEDEGIRPDWPVTLRSHNCTLQSCLREMLSDLNLCAIVKDDVLVITSQICDNELDYRVYPVSDLVDDPASPDELIQTVEHAVAPNSWCCVGGTATMAYFTPRQLLIVNQTRANHAHIERLLGVLRKGGVSSSLRVTSE